MMKTLHKIVACVLAVGLLCVSILTVIKAAGPPENWNEFVEGVFGDKVKVFWQAVGLTMLLLVYVYTSIPRRRKDMYLSFPAEGGSLSVNLRGVAGFLTKLGNDFEGVTGVRARILPKGNTVDVYMEVKVREGVQIQETTELLRTRVRDNLREMLGIEDVGSITIVIKDITSLRRVSREE